MTDASKWKSWFLGGSLLAFALGYVGSERDAHADVCNPAWFCKCGTEVPCDPGAPCPDPKTDCDGTKSACQTGGGGWQCTENCPESGDCCGGTCTYPAE